MSKKHKHHQHAAPPARPTRAARRSAGAPGPQVHDPQARLELIESLVEEERLAEALPLLEALAAGEGRRVAVVWQMLATVQQGLELWGPMARSLTRYIELAPNDPIAHAALATAHLQRDRAGMALQGLRQFLARWPLHAEAENARAMASALEQELTRRLAYSGLTLENGIEPSILHERALDALEKNQYVAARHLEEQTLRLAPSFMPALNTISQVYQLEGRIPQAISAARRVLDQDPANVHALGNLIHFLVISGQRDEALALGPRLRAAPLTSGEAWIKKAEAWSYLADDAALLALLEEVERERDLDDEPAYPYGLHLAAVAAWRLGHPQKARALWRRALALDPTFELAQTNLDDLAKPVGERHAPWPFTINYWMDERVVLSLRELAGQVGKPGKSDIGERVKRSLRMMLAAHPELASLVPVLLERGDPAGRPLALYAALAAETLEMQLALRDFALGEYGPDDLRQQAAQAAAQADLLPGHRARLWLRGEWVELLLYAWAITDEPSFTHPPAVEALEIRAMEAMHAKRNAEAEQLYRQALVLLPNSPEIQNNLAVAIANQGRNDEANAMVDVIFAEHPDYLFGRLSKANKLIYKGDLAAARALIDPVLERKQFHITELRMVCRTQIEYYLAEKNVEAANTWLTMWQRGEIEPDRMEEEWMNYELRIRFLGIQSRRRGPRKAAGKATKRKPAPKMWVKPGTPPVVDALPAAPPPPPPLPPAPGPRLLSAHQEPDSEA